MTTYQKKSEARQTRRRMQTIARSGEKPLRDPGPAANFAHDCLYGRAIEEMTRPAASDVGILALALAGLALKSTREAAGAGGSSRINRKETLEAVLQLFSLTLPLNVRKLNAALNELIALAPVYRGFVCAQEARQKEEREEREEPQERAASACARQKPEAAGDLASSKTDLEKGVPQPEEEPEHAHRLFGRSLARYQFGFDGHWMTRETASRLRLVRYYEKTSGAFAAFVHRAFAVLAQQGAAYMAWSSHFPILICDLNRPAHREAAAVLTEAAHGEAAVVTRPMTRESARALPKGLLVLEDRQGVFEKIAGGFASVMLLERRIGGWTVTFPAGRVPARELKKSVYGKLPLALARCAPQNDGAWEHLQQRLPREEA